MGLGNLIISLWEDLVSLAFPSQLDPKCPPLPNATSNDGHNPIVPSEMDPPSATYFLSNLEVSQIVFLSVGTPLTIATFMFAFVQWYYVWTYISSEERRNWLYFLISLFPVSTMCCLIGMYSPRSAALVSSIGVLYFLTCLFILVALIRHLANGRITLSQLLEERGKLVDFRSPPFCCCLPCLPKVRPTETNLKRLEWIVLQAPILRVFIVFGQVIAVAEQREHSLKLLQLFDMASLASLLFAIFGIHTMARVASDQLAHFGFSWIFRVVDLALFFFTAQQPFLFQNIFLRTGVIHCGPLLSPQDNARFICNFVIICELFTLSLFSTFLVSPRRNVLFDLYRRKHGGSGSGGVDGDSGEEEGARRRLTPSTLTRSTATSITFPHYQAATSTSSSLQDAFGDGRDTGDEARLCCNGTMRSP